MGDLEDSFLDSEEWRERLKRTLLYPGNQSIDNTLPIEVSELCVNSFRAFAPKNESKLGLRVATRLTRNSCLNPSVVMMALIYLKRLQKQDPTYLQHVTSSDLFVVSTMVASKFLFDDGTDDECYNDDWACGVGMELEKLNKLEISFLNALSWNLNVSKADFDSQLYQIESELAKVQMKNRNLFTYNHARNINLTVPIYYLLSLVSKVFVFSTFATFFFVKFVDKTSELATKKSVDTPIPILIPQEAWQAPLNSTFESFDQVEIGAEHTAERNKDAIKSAKQFIKSKIPQTCKNFEPIPKLLSFNLSLCII